MPGRVLPGVGGLVPARVEGEGVAFAAPRLIRSGPVDDADLAVALSVLGVTPADVVEARWVEGEFVEGQDP